MATGTSPPDVDRPDAALSMVNAAAKNGSSLAALFSSTMAITESVPTDYLARRLSGCGAGRSNFWAAWHIDQDIRNAACTATVRVPAWPGAKGKKADRTLQLPLV